jgi:hypothetical protein
MRRSFISTLIHSQSWEPSSCYPYNSAVFCLAKKQLPNAALGDPVPLRVVLYFWAVKARSLPFSYGVKEVRECSNKVSKAHSMVLTTVDLTSGFWQQMLEEKSRHYTAFSVPGKGARYQWRVTPMALQGLPALFAGLTNFVLSGVLGIIMCIDDRGLKDHEKNYGAFLLEKAVACWAMDHFDITSCHQSCSPGARTTDRWRPCLWSA